MSTEIEPTSFTSTHMTMREAALRLASAKVVSDFVKTGYENMRAAFLDQLVRSWRRTGSKSFNVLLPSGEKVASVSLSEPKDKAVVSDRDAFTAWVAETYETEVVERIVYEVRAAFEKRLLEKDIIFVARTDDDGKPVLTEAGEPVYDAVVEATGDLVPGVRFHKAGAPTSFSLREEKPKASGVRTEDNQLNGYERLMDYLTGQGIYAFPQLVEADEIVIEHVEEAAEAADSAAAGE